MLQRYRTLAAMTRLAEFTVADLAKAGDVPLSTARTVLRREGHRVDRVATIPRASGGGRGGRYIRYRLRQGEADKIVTELRELEETGQLNREIQQHSAPADDTAVPQGLLAARHVLVHRLAAVTDPDSRRELLELASESIADATEDWDLVELGLMGRAGLANAHATMLLHDLADAELRLAAEDDPGSANVPELRHRLRLRRLQLDKIAHHVPGFDLLDLIDARFAEVFNGPDSPVLVVTPDNDENEVSHLVYEWTHTQAIGFARVALGVFRSESHRRSVEPSLCVLALPSNDSPTVRTAVKEFVRDTPVHSKGLVVSDKFSASINRVTSEHHVQYRTFEGLAPADLGGVLCQVAPSLQPLLSSTAHAG